MMREGTARANGDGAGFHGPLLVDAHVHFYGCYDPVVFFEGALGNFRAAAAAYGVAPEPVGCLLFTEGAGDHYFQHFQAQAEGRSIGPWRFRRTAEDCSLIASRDGEARLLLVAGRQIATKEGLEVLALGCATEFSDGLSLQATLERVLESGALPVLPWGFGKWWFRRGALMSQAVRSLDPAQVCLGDNSGRPHGFPAPRLFRVARSRGIKILPGTDPLPFPSEAGKAGSYGFMLEGDLRRDEPAAGLKALLRAQGVQPRVYGRLESLMRFSRHQVMMQLRKHAAS